MTQEMHYCVNCENVVERDSLLPRCRAYQGDGAEPPLCEVMRNAAVCDEYVERPDKRKTFLVSTIMLTRMWGI